SLPLGPAPNQALSPLYPSDSDLNSQQVSPGSPRHPRVCIAKQHRGVPREYNPKEFARCKQSPAPGKTCPQERRHAAELSRTVALDCNVQGPCTGSSEYSGDDDKSLEGDEPQATPGVTVTKSSSELPRL
ncbi:hypothetical protein MTO96_039179, partial [Rhipicephalus appendiculatus]